MAVLSSSIIITFTAVCFRHRDLLVSFGYKMLALVLGITFLRFALPFQFPFTTNIVLNESFSRMIALFRRPVPMADSFEASQIGRAHV